MYCNYAYNMKNCFDLEGIRQFVKLSHAYKVVEDMDNPKILDIGAGYGEFAMFLKQNNFSCSYIALDIVDRFLGKNRDSFPKVFKFYEVDIAVQSLLSLFDKREFDAVFLLDSIQSIDKELGKRTIKEVSKIIKMGGKLGISTRNSLLSPDTDKSHVVYCWDIWEMLDELYSNGFEILDIFGVNLGKTEENIKTDSCIGRFFPRRFYRVFAGLENWDKCKFVMIDCVRK